jgi:hypothetical protein
MSKFSQEELEKSKRIFKSATPKQDLSWYVKWIASCFILSSMSIRGIEGLQIYDLILSLIGVTGWMIVGILWKEKSLIVLNAGLTVIYIVGIIENFIAQ